MDGNKNCHHSCLAVGHATNEKRALVFVLFLCHPQNTLLVYLSKCYLSSLYLYDHCFVECSPTIPCTTTKEMCFWMWKNFDLERSIFWNQTSAVLLMIKVITNLYADDQLLTYIWKCPGNLEICSGCTLSKKDGS